MEYRQLQLGVFTSLEFGPDRDEFLSIDSDPRGEQKVSTDGHLQGGREYRIKTFTLPGRGDKLYMMATECAKELLYRDSYLLFNKNKSLYKMIASQSDKETLIKLGYLPFSFRSRQIALVTARSMFRQFGAKVIKNGRRVVDDYWETKALQQGFKETDLLFPLDSAKKAAAAAAAAAAKEGSPKMSSPATPSMGSQRIVSAGAVVGFPASGVNGSGNGGGPTAGGSNTGVFIPGSGINVSFDFQEDHKRRDIIGASSQHERVQPVISEGAMYEAQETVSQFNKYLNDQRKLRVGMWQNFWTLRQEQQENLLKSGLDELFGETNPGSPGGEMDEEALALQHKKQQILEMIPQPQPGALEGDPPPVVILPPPPVRAGPGAPHPQQAQAQAQAAQAQAAQAQAQAQAHAQAQAQAQAQAAELRRRQSASQQLYMRQQQAAQAQAAAIRQQQQAQAAVQQQAAYQQQLQQQQQQQQQHQYNQQWGPPPLQGQGQPQQQQWAGQQQQGFYQ